MNLVKKELTPEQESKVKKDLEIINRISKIGRDKNLRIIISGGYGVDGFFGEITRPHNDIDIQVYGTDEDAESVIRDLLSSIGDFDLIEEERKVYYKYFVAQNGGAKLDISYLQTATSPMGSEKYIVKSDGEVDKQNFTEPQYGHIGDISFEIQDPNLELKDKIYKREERGDVKRSEHEQDIKNLRDKLEL